jgi:hypothetical protein
VNHPASVNTRTNDQPSSSSDNFSPFTSSVSLRSSDISSVPRLNLKPNPRSGTAKQITSSPYNKSVEAIQQKKIKQATKSKSQSAFFSSWSFKKKAEKGLPGSISV